MGKYFWKSAISIAVFVWAIVSLIPFKDTPFDVFMANRATAQKEAFAKHLDEATTLVKAGKASTLFLALKQMGETTDFSVYFPDIKLADIKNQKRRNDILLNELLRQSQARLKQGLDLKGGVAFTLQIDPSALEGKHEFEKVAQLNKAIDIMSRRIDGLGVAEPIIRAKGNNQVEIQLPGISTRDNPEVVNVLKKPAKLEFRLVAPRESQVPVGYEKLMMERESSRGEKQEIPVYVKRIPEMTGKDVKNAFVSMNPYGGYEISLIMTDTGTQRFAQVTKDNIGRQLGIVLDGKLYSAPNIQTEIPNGRASISGDFTQRTALELANVLNNPLEFELTLAEMYEVGPSLAQDARTSSINASILGAGLVIVFMILYYMLPGVVAVFTVLFNVLIVLGVLSSLGATMTLPGVAALVLTIGMGVDANILIYERMREEIRIGKGMKAALSAGYEKAFATILDANLTTLLTAGILIWLGTGPIKGFGIILSIGIVATLFCSLVVSRVILELLVYSGIIKTAFTHTYLRETHFNFMKYSKPAFIGSWLIVLIGVVVVFQKGDRIYGIDFVGGDEIALSFKEKPTIRALQDFAKEHALGEFSPVYQKLIGEDNEILKIQTEEGKGNNVFSALEKGFPKSDMKLISQTTIGGSVSDSIKMDALIAILASIVVILIYVAFRFEFGYGMGAVVSTVHDVLMTIGLFVMLGGQFTAPMVAAILMIVGYSINDTIVVFDRIREELDLNPSMKLKDVIHLAINRTLSRTLLTSLTTLIAALALYIFGAGVINDFALVFTLGILTGTFSSIFVASPVFFWYHKGDRRHIENHHVKPKYEWDAGN
ncbi:MAG: preprotein translocase subunit SecD [Verrucomicrobia bacterium GWF2_51_19]|nr:MAG: preprotein translocase subunit SecD [Verrucomicrobia bacterium GWF2_51_19]HCJ11682.1 protein translocase subunit SecDF [Opitutae bacterium]